MGRRRFEGDPAEKIKLILIIITVSLTRPYLTHPTLRQSIGFTPHPPRPLAPTIISHRRFIIINNFIFNSNITRAIIPNSRINNNIIITINLLITLLHLPTFPRISAPTCFLILLFHNNNNKDMPLLPTTQISNSNNNNYPVCRRRHQSLNNNYYNKKNNNNKTNKISQVLLQIP